MSSPGTGRSVNLRTLRRLRRISRNSMIVSCLTFCRLIAGHRTPRRRSLENRYAPQHAPVGIGKPCKPGSVLRTSRSLCHLSTTTVTRRLQQPTPGIGRATLNCRYTRSCNPRDVRPDDIAASAVGSYPAFSPLPGGMHPAGRSFSVTLPYPYGHQVVSLHGALRCPDFPPLPKQAATERTCRGKDNKIPRIAASRAAVSACGGRGGSGKKAFAAVENGAAGRSCPARRACRPPGAICIGVK